MSRCNFIKVLSPFTNFVKELSPFSNFIKELSPFSSTSLRTLFVPKVPYCRMMLNQFSLIGNCLCVPTIPILNQTSLKIKNQFKWRYSFLTRNSRKRLFQIPLLSGHMFYASIVQTEMMSCRLKTHAIPKRLTHARDCTPALYPKLNNDFSWEFIDFSTWLHYSVVTSGTFRIFPGGTWNSRIRQLMSNVPLLWFFQY